MADATEEAEGQGVDQPGEGTEGKNNDKNCCYTDSFLSTLSFLYTCEGTQGELYSLCLCLLPCRAVRGSKGDYCLSQYS